MSQERTSRIGFDVWAPVAGSVTLLADGQEHPMHKLEGGPDGWWTVRDTGPGKEGSGHETDYGYLVDGEGPFPDPRSLRQPRGVHELSRTFDPTEYAWTDAPWKGRELQGSVIYELHIGTFTPEGTLDAASEKLDYLVDLGVDFVELLPVNAFNGTHNWGYDGVLWFAVHEAYGGPEAYQRFVDAAHAVGLGVIQDVVYNHLGPSGNYLAKFGPYLKSGEGNTWGDSVNLDGPGSDEVRGYILDNAAMWLRDFHVDGLRLDAVHALRDERAVHILEDLAVVADKIEAVTGIPRTLIAESDLNNPRLIYPQEANGYGLEGQWSDDFHHAVHVNLTGETAGYYSDFQSLTALAKVLEHGFYHDGSYSSFRGRHHGRPIRADLAHPSALVVCSQNHDQIGNRATGDRLTETLSYGRLSLAAVLTMTSPFTPMLFMGEEFGASTPWQFFTSHPEEWLAEATAKGRLKEFERMGWDPAVVPNPQDPETFSRSKLKWEEASQGEHARLLDLYRALGALRRSTPELSAGGFQGTEVEFDDDEQWLILVRGTVRVVYNFGAEEMATNLDGDLLLATDPKTTLDDGTLTVPAESAAVLRIQVPEVTEVVDMA
ncbi:malto-oligosyltrehalose trehalohydrolase [Arthrobacter sp. ISL-30]|uniref:malto-oligosyltrehalose trehalohydrolase n=1 Tax=Arthrobacter sp. ISL-30 TaxID=2819109 RepID=UPI001BE5D13B|nr:malto-oligosyltrehalose trehalohydrolase [Arthrobacter sp. ISL-30]MBT2514353.1 malto-oligosyltrehalose trehalohydrolase [Arthrobacter sp. ISL-30]